MAGHLASNFAFWPPPGGGGDGPGGPEQGWIDPQTLLSFPHHPDGPEIGPGIGPGLEFCGGVAYCGPQVGKGLIPHGGLETSQPESEVGAGMESNSEGASPEPCIAHPAVVKSLALLFYH
uniref:Uncharacterized protein n=1 Tax=Urocitellus parryii TaxID=9999 RepID=A0A8D2H152_UROPR